MKKTASIVYLALACVLMVMSSASHAQFNPRPGWLDSYSVDGKCYCDTTFDHGIGEFEVDTPAGSKTVREVCAAIGRGPGRGNNPIYNTVQCGNPPWHFEGNPPDEVGCPGRVDMGPSGCQIIGPKWDLSVFGPPEEPELHTIPGTIEAEDYASQSGTRTLNTSDVGGGEKVGFIENGDYLEFDVEVTESTTYKVDFRISSNTGGSSIEMTANGTAVGSVDVPDTGGFQTWQTVSTRVNLTTAQDTLRLTFTGGSGYLVDVNRMEITKVIDDPVDPAVISITDLSVKESDGVAAVIIALSRPVSSDVTMLAYTRASGGAVGGEDYYGFTREVRIGAGDTRATLPVTIISDTTRESTETFGIRLIDPVGATIGDGEATITITDDGEIPPAFSISSAPVNEADGEATVTVTLSQPVDASVTVFSRPGTATGGSDYFGFTQTLEFSGGSTEATVQLSVLDDTIAEPEETLTVHLVSASGATISNASATVSITDDD